MAYYGTALLVGMLIGFGGLYVLALLVKQLEEQKFRRYLLERDDVTRDTMKQTLDDILDSYEMIAQKTNTTLFKRKSNQIRDLLTFIQKYKIDN